MARSGLTDVLRVREFRVLFGAELVSSTGDQIARVALAVLVYVRTDSAAYAAGTYALTFLPALLGGVLLGWTADRMRRREVMVTADLLRAAGIGVMAVPGVPLWLLCVLLVAVVLLGAPHSGAQGALLPEILGERYERGLALRTISGQTAQLAGFAVGGAVVAALGPPLALAVDAVTFLLSAVIVRAGLAARPSPAPVPARTDSGSRHGILAGMTAIAADPRRRTIVALAWTVGAFVVEEGLAVPYAAQLGHGVAAADPAGVGAVSGLLMAANPLGSVIGAWAFIRFVPRHLREQLVGVVAVVAGLPLVLVALRPGVAVTFLLWGLAGAGTSAYLLQSQAMFVRATPAALRGSAIGVAASGIVASQGLAVLLGGVLADATDAATAIAVSGAVGSALALSAAVVMARTAATALPPAGTRQPGDHEPHLSHVRDQRHSTESDRGLRSSTPMSDPRPPDTPSSRH